MQAMEIKWPAVNRIVVAAIAVAMFTAGTIGAFVLNQAGSGSDTALPISIPGLPASSVTQTEETRYLEQNTELPAGASVDSTTGQAVSGSSRPVEEMLYIEQNTWLPAGGSQPLSVTDHDLANSPVVNR